LKIWTIILTIGQHCHFLIFGFGVAHENREDPPIYELELGLPIVCQSKLKKTDFFLYLCVPNRKEKEREYQKAQYLVPFQD
jgi:hypothetical protein